MKWYLACGAAGQARTKRHRHYLIITVSLYFPAARAAAPSRRAAANGGLQQPIIASACAAYLQWRHSGVIALSCASAFVASADISAVLHDIAETMYASKDNIQKRASWR